MTRRRDPAKDDAPAPPEPEGKTRMCKCGHLLISHNSFKECLYRRCRCGKFEDKK